ncbi:CGCGG family rSAM-modified RiPP protein [Alicyclobacillus sp. SO9]|nr:CGCGG family rSAM-modified RiPP protein [Alicyclobacillus sp. SO9]
MNLETDEYIEDRDLIIEDSMKAIEETEPGYFVNLAVADNHGNPDGYLIPVLKAKYRESVDIHFIDQCGCGGYVYRVHKTKQTKRAAN